MGETLDFMAGHGDDAQQRLRDLLSLAADFAFETDALGRLAFVSHAATLGWTDAELVGRAGASLLHAPAGQFDPFAAGPAYAHQRTQLRHAGGGAVCLSFSAVPIKTAGRAAGMRGVAQAVLDQDEAVASALRRNKVMERIMWQVRQEVLASRMMQAVLEGLIEAVDGEGSAVLNLLAKPDGGVLLHDAGRETGPDPAALLAGLQVEVPDPIEVVVGGWSVLACPSYTRYGDRAGLYLWRAAGDKTGWSDSDRALMSSVLTIVRMVLEHEGIQRELARQARTDPLTGLLNRRAFLEEVTRRIDRLDREGMPGTLMYVDLDHFKMLNDCCGHEAGDRALVQAASLLRNTVRPADIVARLGGDEFALWLDGSDELTAAERAERLRIEGPACFAAVLPDSAPLLSTSVGIAARHPRGGEALDEVMRRADLAMYDVKRAGRAHWRVARDPWAL